MIVKTLFSEKALAKRAQREAVDAKLQVTAPHEWVLVSGLGVALLALLIYGLLGEAEMSLSTDAVLVHPGERVDVLADATGVVDEVLTQVGEMLVEDEPIARVRPARTTPFAGPQGDAQELTHLANRMNGETRIDPNQDIVAPRDGVVASLSLVAGQRVESSELVARLRAMSAGPMEVLAFVSGKDALRLSKDKQAQVRVAVPGEDRFLILPVRIEHVSLRTSTPPAWIIELGLNPGAQAHLVRATLTEPDRQAIPDGTKGTLRIVLGERSFVSLLFGGDRT